LAKVTARHRRIILLSSNPENQIRPTFAKLSVSFGSASKAGFGQPSRQFAEELFIHGVTIQKSTPRPRHISNSWLCMTWLKLGDSKAEGLPSIQLTLNGAIDVRTDPLPITSIAHFRPVPRILVAALVHRGAARSTGPGFP
jgi:hypothetical protein